MNIHQYAFRAIVAALVALAVSACGNMGDRRAPIPTATTSSAKAPGEVLVVVLPGRWDNVEVMQGSGITESIQAAWPEADVLLTSATMAYYTDGQLPARLHEQVIAPARARGYREIWMMGASMGGMGTLLYEQAYPGELDGLVLLAPFMGGRGVLREISESGGIADWDPGPEPAQVGRSNYDRELWRYLQTWLADPALGQRTWLAYGADDRLRNAVPVFAPLVPDAHILERPGGHAWTVWVPAAGDVLRAARAGTNQGTATGVDRP